MRKRNREDLTAFRRGLFDGTSLDDLDDDQRTVRQSFATIWGLLTSEKDRLDKEIENAVTFIGPPSEADAKKWFETEISRSNVLTAMDTVHALHRGFKHPIFDYVDATVATERRGQPPVGYREGTCRAICVAFIDIAMEKAVFPTRKSAAEHLSKQLESLKIGLRSPKAILGYDTNRSFGAAGESTYDWALAQMKPIPADKLSNYAATFLARNYGGHTIVNWHANQTQKGGLL